MEKITGNEPAFAAVNAGNDQPSFYEKGLTIRQHFAAMAMQGMIASYTDKRPREEVVAEFAVKAADALINELNKTPSNE